MAVSTHVISGVNEEGVAVLRLSVHLHLRFYDAGRRLDVEAPTSVATGDAVRHQPVLPGVSVQRRHLQVHRGQGQGKRSNNTAENPAFYSKAKTVERIFPPSFSRNTKKWYKHIT